MACSHGQACKCFEPGWGSCLDLRSRYSKFDIGPCSGLDITSEAVFDAQSELAAAMEKMKGSRAPSPVAPGTSPLVKSVKYVECIENLDHDTA